MVFQAPYEVEKFLHQYWEEIGTPLSKALSQALYSRNGELFKKLLDTNPSHMTNPSRMMKARLALDIVKKSDFITINDIDKTRNAIISWCSAEVACRRTAYNVSLFRMNHSKLPQKWYDVVPRIRRIVRRILGPVPDLQDVFGGFGPGATLSNTRSNSAVVYKLAALKPTVSENALWFYPALPKRLQNLWPETSLDLCSAGRFHLVPKSYKTDRPIMVEPLVNASIQKFFGAHIRARLKRIGIDLDHGGEYHRDLAYKGSLDGSVATLDLSSASDTISYELVKLLLPWDWFRCLDACRTPQIDLREYYDKYSDIFTEHGIGPVHHLSKFSSMGNGFTFELESLLFYSIVQSVSKTLGIFGDDIICPSIDADEVASVLTLLGFTINTDKSYSSGLFRESCGGDFCYGVDVKGITLKTEPTHPNDWMDLHNRIFIMSDKRLIPFKKTLRYIKQRVPSHLRLDIPVRLGSGGFFSYHPKGRIKDSIIYYKAHIPVTRYKEYPDWLSEDAILASLLLGLAPTDSRGHLIGLPDPFRMSWKEKWVPLS